MAAHAVTPNGRAPATERIDPRQWADLFAALAAPFDPAEVKVRSIGGQKAHYVTARTIMNRLDDVLGPENWWDEFPLVGEHSVVCRLTIRLPDGAILTKCDAGGYAGMQDPGDDDKSGFADSFKRAAVKFGVGRYLYRDGIPKFARERLGKPDKPGAPPAPRQADRGARDWIARQCSRIAEKCPGVDPSRLYFQVINHVVTALVGAGLIAGDDVQTDGKRDGAKAARELERVWQDDPDPVKVETAAYLKRKLAEARAAPAEELSQELPRGEGRE